MQFPENLKYTKDHEWVRVEGDKAIIGITDFAQGELGDIVYIDINSLGSTMAKEEVFGTVEAVKTVSDLFMPLSGKVLNINSAINNQPDLVNKDPYGNGWIIEVSCSDLSEIDSLLSATAYRELIGH